jgi:methyl-accepting chemotaxis protein
MNLKQRILLIPVATALIFALGVGIVAWVSHRTTGTITQLGAADYPYLDGITEFSGQLESLVAVVQSAVAEGEKDRLKDVEARSKTMSEQLAKLKGLAGKEAAVTTLEGQFNSYASATLDAAGILLGAKQGDQAQAVPKMQAAYKTLEASVRQTRESAKAAMDQGISSAESGVSAGLKAMVLSSLLVVVALGLGSVFLIRSIWSQIGGEPEYARAVLQKMAGGDLSQQVIVSGTGPSLLGAVREMCVGLASIVATVRQGSDSMATASQEIASGNQDLSQRTERTASSLQQTASSVTQLSGTVHQTADSARTANQLATSAAEVAQRGGAVVARVVDTMGEINASSRKISDIIGVIDGIAFQTNILALNAAVEAARAGEQGRGFAVVASEVRSLAKRSADAAREIKALIGTSVDKVEIGAKLVADAGQTMTEIVASVQRVTDIIGEITAASAEQSDGIGQVNQAVAQLDQMTQQNAALVEESAAAAESLREQAGKLTGVVATFRLPA